MPDGQVIYDSLMASFIDLPRVLKTLEHEGHTGYLRLSADDHYGLLLFQAGTNVESLYQGPDGDGLMMGERALARFRDDVQAGDGVLDLVGLTADIVKGLHGLSTSRPVYVDLYAAWVNAAALLEFLRERKVSGSIVVRSNGQTGVILLSQGGLVGAYTSESRDIAGDPGGVLALCHDPKSVIEVKSMEALPAKQVSPHTLN